MGQLNMNVGHNVAAHRRSRGLSQAELATRLAEVLGKKKIDPTTITRLESGKRPTTVDELSALADIFGVSAESLLQTDDSPRAQLRELTTKVQQARRRADESATNLRSAQSELDQAMADLSEFATRLTKVGASPDAETLQAAAEAIVYLRDLRTELDDSAT